MASTHYAVGRETRVRNSSPMLTLRARLVLLVLLCGGACAPAAPQVGQPAAAAAQPTRDGGATGSAPALSAPRAVDQLRVSWSSVSSGFLPFHAALERGLFEQRGLKVEPVFTSGAQAVTALVAGELDAAYTDGAALVRARLAGADTVVLASTSNAFPYKLIGEPALQSTNDLRGKRLGITRTGSTSDFAARYMLRTLGLAPGEDVALIQTGTGQEMMPALAAGAINAAVLGEPLAHEARRQGYTFLYDLGALPVEYPTTALGSLRSTVGERPEALRAFVGGLVEATAWVKQNRAEAREVLARFTRLEDPEAIDAGYEEVAERFVQAPYPTLGGMMTILESTRAEDPRVADAQPADFIEDRFVRELDQSGFIRQLYP